MDIRKAIVAFLLLAGAACASAPRTDCEALNAQLHQGVALSKPDGSAFVERVPRNRSERLVERMARDSVIALGLESVPAPAVLRMRVTAAGAADEVRVVRSSGSMEFDSIAAWAMRQSGFVPASLDGCPVAVFIEVPLSVTIPRN